MGPNDLIGKSGEVIAEELFGESLGDESSWVLTRVDEHSLDWIDRRLGITWRVRHGLLVALHEVSAASDAHAFANKNKITLYSEGGLFLRGVAELPIASSRPPASATVAGFPSSSYGLQTSRGLELIVGSPSFLFIRLIGAPMQEENPGLPDPSATRTLVIRSVDRSDVHLVAETALFLLRKYGDGARFQFYRYGDPAALSLDDDDPNAPVTLPAEPTKDTHRPETLAFFNRAEESDAITSFLYYYRVIEACFEDVLRNLVRTWRLDTSMDELQLLKNVRVLKDREDTTGLRQVLSHLVDQPLLDQATTRGLIAQADADALANQIYERRNSIAHGRRGKHPEVLVPFAFSPGRDAHHLAWRDLMRILALRAIERWILVE